MGYQRPVLKLKFDDPEMTGFEMVVKRPGFGRLEQVIDKDRDLDIQIEVLSECIISWNLEDDKGNPVPTTLEGLKSQDQPFLLAIVTAWLKQAITVSDDLGKDSPSGDALPEVPIPMEPLSGSLPN